MDDCTHYIHNLYYLTQSFEKTICLDYLSGEDYNRVIEHKLLKLYAGENGSVFPSVGYDIILLLGHAYVSSLQRLTHSTNADTNPISRRVSRKTTALGFESPKLI